jgi:glycosyltransferase family protein
MKVSHKILNKVDWVLNTNLSKLASKILKVKVYNFDESLEILIREKCSLSRFGDGEFTLLLNGSFYADRNRSLRFQKANPVLKKKLQEILSDKNIKSFNLRIAVSYPIHYYDNNILTQEACDFWDHYLKELRYKIIRKLRKDYDYIDTCISRFYMDFKDKSPASVESKIKKLKTLWEKENVLFIEGKNSCLGVNNDLFNNANNIKRILTPNEDAFDYYSEILSAALKYGKNKLIILAVGPTATVLAYDLAKQGYRALDLGHIDIEYSWYLMGATEKTAVKGKNMTEVVKIDNGENDYINQNDLTDYENQVVYSIL